MATSLRERRFPRPMLFETLAFQQILHFEVSFGA
jgi:hypothetical protein